MRLDAAACKARRSRSDADAEHRERQAVDADARGHPCSDHLRAPRAQRRAEAAVRRDAATERTVLDARLPALRQMLQSAQLAPALVAGERLVPWAPESQRRAVAPARQALR